MKKNFLKGEKNTGREIFFFKNAKNKNEEKRKGLKRKINSFLVCYFYEKDSLVVDESNGIYMYGAASIISWAKLDLKSWLRDWSEREGTLKK